MERGQQPTPPTVAASTTNCTKCQEMRLEKEKLSAKCDHLSSQSSLLSLTLEDSKSLTDRLTVLLGKHEANGTAMQLVINYSDYIVEAYDVLLALMENPNGIKPKNVAKHLLSRLEKNTPNFVRSDSGLGGSMGDRVPSHLLDTTWEDSSGYSQTARYTTRN